MAVAPLQIPGYAAPQSLDFTSLDQLGKTLQSNQLSNSRKEALSLATLGQAPGAQPDYGKSVNALIGMGDIAGAGQVAAIQKAVAPESSADLQAYGMYRKQGGTAGLLDFLKEKAAAGATKVTTNNSVTTGGGGSDKQIFDNVDESAKAARAAATGLSGLTEAQKALQAGIISGAGADQRLGLQKIGSYLGITDPAAIQNTETFRAAIAPQVAAMIKSTVGTANISNSDREFAEKAAGGNINLDAGSITRLVGIMHKAGSGIVNAHNQRLEAIYPDSPNAKFKRERALFGVNAPPALQQSGGGRLRFNPSTGSLE